MATLGANDGTGHRSVAYTATALVASYFSGRGGPALCTCGPYLRRRSPRIVLSVWLIAGPALGESPAGPLGADQSRAARSEAAPAADSPRSEAGDEDTHPDAPQRADGDAADPEADEPPPQEPEAPSAEQPREPVTKLYSDPLPPQVNGIHMGTPLYTRTGLHARVTVGMSYLHIFNSSAANLGEQTNLNVEHSSVSAAPVELELWLGGALLRDLALNLVLRTGQASTGRLHTDLQNLPLAGGLTTAFVGVGLVYYLDPAWGWLIGAAAGLERWQASFTQGTAPQVGGSGIAVSLYGGHDWWLGPTIAFGIVPRLNVGFATGDGQAEVGELQLENSDVDLYVQAGVAVSLSYF